ncbi:MAG TPA: hypothetical protein VGV67_14465 [Solirubrobacteraceae bacterium]|nr:hypothetical protein [Solirubrobacteraceae bacterium]
MRRTAGSKLRRLGRLVSGCGDVGLAVVGVRELLVTAPEQLLRAAVEQAAQGGVDADVLALRVEERHTDRGAVEGQVEQAARLLEQQPAVELAQDDDAVAGRSVAVGDADVRDERHVIAVAALGPKADRLVARHRQLGPVEQRGDVVARRIAPEQSFGVLVAGDDEAVAVDQQRNIGQHVERQGSCRSGARRARQASGTRAGGGSGS